MSKGLQAVDWFKGTPQYQGVYARLNTSTGREFYQYWTGSYWGRASTTKKGAINLGFDETGIGDAHEWPWREVTV